MTNLEIKQLLSFMKDQFDITSDLSYNLDIPKAKNIGFKFFGEHGLHIYLRGKGETLEIDFKSARDNDKIIANFNLPIKDCENFLDYISPVLEEKIYNKEEEPTDFAKQQLSYIKEYLKTVPYEKLVSNINAGINIPNEHGWPNRLLLGLSKQFNQEMESLDYVSIPCSIFNSFSPTEMAERVNLTIPTWKLYHYPALADFVKITQPDSTMEGLLEQLHKLSPNLSTKLNYHILDCKIENKTEAVTKFKI